MAENSGCTDCISKENQHEFKRAIRIILIALFFFKHNVRRRLTEKALHTGILC